MVLNKLIKQFLPVETKIVTAQCVQKSSMNANQIFYESVSLSHVYKYVHIYVLKQCM